MQGQLWLWIWVSTESAWVAAPPLGQPPIRRHIVGLTLGTICEPCFVLSNTTYPLLAPTSTPKPKPSKPLQAPLNEIWAVAFCPQTLSSWRDPDKWCLLTCRQALFYRAVQHSSTPTLCYHTPGTQASWWEHNDSLLRWRWCSSGTLIFRQTAVVILHHPTAHPAHVPSHGLSSGSNLVRGWQGQGQGQGQLQEHGLGMAQPQVVACWK